ncbi:MAG: ParA family protein [Deltaproteobacteria bacterium]|nr:ParA family protein [Deltaproteobacteria bacterium]
MAEKTRPIIISILNHKGGVGKTTTCINLGAGLARVGKRVLLIDMDAQGNLTESLGRASKETQKTIYNAFVDEISLDDIIVPTLTHNLHFVPGSEAMAALDLTIGSTYGREFLLRNRLSETEKLSNYDFVIIDNPPSISLATANALVASDYYVVPLTCEYLPLIGLKLLKRSVKQLEALNPKLQSLGVLLTMYSKNEKITKKIESLVEAQLGGGVFKTRIRTNTKAKAAPIGKKTLFEFEGKRGGRGTEDYTKFTEEFLLRIDERTKAREERNSNGATNQLIA